MFRFGDRRDLLLQEAVRAGAVQQTVVLARRGGVDLLPSGTSPSTVLAGFGTGEFGMMPFGGALVVEVAGEPSGLAILSGGVTDSPGEGGVRRTLELEVEDSSGALFDLLAPTGTTLHPFAVVRLTDGETLSVPQGVFDVDVQRAGLGPSGGLSITAPDKYARIQRAKLLRPYQSQVGMTNTQQIAELVYHGLGRDERVLNFSTSQATVGNLVWDEDLAKPIEDLAKAAGVHVGFDRLGRCCITDLPTLSSASDWLVDASPRGVLLSGDRERHRRSTANVVIVTSDKADSEGPGFAPVIVWDNDPASPTYAGPDPINRPDLAGPFGVVPFRYSSPLVTTALAAETAARAILARVVGLASQLNLSAVQNPALDAHDVVSVLPPRRHAGADLTVERHVVDAVTHPLGGGVQQITGRSTRADDYSA